MDYQELVRRIDQIQMSDRDRAAAKIQLAHAVRLADWTLAAAGGVKKATRFVADGFLRPALTRIRSPLDRPRTA